METAHKLSLEGRKKLTVTGVDEVLGFDESVVSVKIGETTLSVTGRSLTITRLTVPEKTGDVGEIIVDGEIDALVYTAKSAKKSFRIFK